MKYTVTLNDSISFQPSSEVEEILQNVRTILLTRLGSVPLDRDFGLSWEHIDKPVHIAQALTRAEIIEAIEKEEPRAVIESVEFEETAEDAMEGLSRPRVIVSIGEDNE